MMIWKAILLVWKVRLQYFFRKKNAFIRVGSTVLFSLLMLGYAYGIAYGIDQVYAEADRFPPEYVGLGLHIFLALMVFLKGLFPVYQQRVELVAPFYPVPTWQKWLVDGFVALGNVFFLVLWLFFITIVLRSNHYGWLHALNGFLMILTAFTLNQTLHSFLEKELKHLPLSLGLWVLFVLGYVFTQFWLYKDIERYALSVHLVVNGVSLLLLLVADLQIEHQVIAHKENLPSQFSPNFFYQNPLRMLWFRNAKSRTVLLLGLLNKIILLGILTMRDTDSNFLGFFIWMVFSPLLLFTYVYMNSWGYFPELWLKIDKADGRLSRLAWVQAELLLVPLLSDCLAGFIILIIYQKINLFYVIFYLSGLVCCFVVSLWASVLSPKQVKSSFALGGNTHIGYGFLLIILILLMAIPQKLPWFYLLNLFIVLASIFTWRDLEKTYQKKKYRLYEKLFKGD